MIGKRLAQIAIEISLTERHIDSMSPMYESPLNDEAKKNLHLSFDVLKKALGNTIQCNKRELLLSGIEETS
jgi:hypothetical protein